MDNPCGLSADKPYETLKRYGELTAHELAALCKVSLKQVLCAVHHEGFSIEAVAWDGPSWKYRARIALSKRSEKPADKAREYMPNSTSRGPYQP